MNTLNRGTLPALLLATVLVAGCGGRTDNTAGGGGGNPVAGAPGDIGTSVTALLAFVNDLFSASENSDPIDVNTLSLAVDDAGEAAAVAF